MTQYALQHPVLVVALALAALVTLDNIVGNICRCGVFGRRKQ